MYPPLVRSRGVVCAAPAEVFPLVLALVPRQIGLVERHRPWVSLFKPRCHWTSFATFNSTNCTSLVKPRAHLDFFVKRNKYVFGWWFTFSLSQASSFDSRTKCLFSSSRNAFRPCWLWNETIAQPYLSVRLVNGLAYNYSDVGEYEQGECMYVDLTPTQVLSCLFLNQWELLGSQSGQDWISW